MSPVTVPAATYRLQFNASFTFDAATAIVDYLDTLGISHCYASSYFKAVPGSTHGYDVADPTQLNPEIGNHDTYDRHGYASDEPRAPPTLVASVLENGPSSRYAQFFDIDSVMEDAGRTWISFLEAV